MQTAAPALATFLLALLAGVPAAAQDISVSGRYEHRTDAESLDMQGGLVCFYPDDASAKRLPRPRQDTQLAWFCLRNSKAAVRQLGMGQRPTGLRQCGFRGQARIRVDRYLPYLGEGDGFDTARLRAVLQKSAPEAIPCL